MVIISYLPLYHNRKASLNSATISFKVDTIPPQPAVITSIRHSSDLVSGFAEPNSKIKVYLDGDKIGQTKADFNGKWGFSPPDTKAIKPGAHKLSISVADAAGNVSSMAERSVTF